VEDCEGRQRRKEKVDRKGRKGKKTRKGWWCYSGWRTTIVRGGGIGAVEGGGFDHTPFNRTAGEGGPDVTRQGRVGCSGTRKKANVANSKRKDTEKKEKEKERKGTGRRGDLTRAPIFVG
jgi:hypothetical protein